MMESPLAETHARTAVARAQLDDTRGAGAMKGFIATELSLFVILFFSYFFLAKGDWRWQTEEPPKLALAFIMLGVLLVSSAVLHWGEKQVENRRRTKAGRIALAITVILRLLFLGIQALEYREHLRYLTPQTNAYGSIFYTITSFHSLHLVIGLLMLLYVLMLPELEKLDHPPFRPFHNAALYWHFVDVVWIAIVGILYVGPNLRA